MKKFLTALLVIVCLLFSFIGTANAYRCQLNAGAYIAHEKRHIDEAWNNVWNGRWGALSVMADQGKLRKINRAWNINTIHVGKNIVKFSVKVAPGKKIYTLKMFTTCK